MLEKYVRLDYFIVSFAIGILYVYLAQPEKEIVYRFPNPNNLNDLIYKDKSDTCYKYKVEEKKCSELNKDQIKQQPILETFNKLILVKSE